MGEEGEVRAYECMGREWACGGNHESGSPISHACLGDFSRRVGEAGTTVAILHSHPHPLTPHTHAHTYTHPFLYSQGQC